jgi:uncharacterized membrane protein
MEQRPKLKLKLSTSDWVIELLGWLALVGFWILVLVNYNDLPESIPTHFNGAGVADDFGRKNTIIILPILGTILFLAITYINQFPHIFNYLSKITQENAQQQYTNATKMMRFLKLVLLITFGLIAFKTIEHAKGNSEGLGEWFLPITILILVVPLVVFTIKSLTSKSLNKN